MRLKRSLIAGVAAAALVLTGCAGGDNDPAGPDIDESDLPAGVSINDDGHWILKRNEPVMGGSLKIGLEAPTESLDPAGLVNAANYTIFRGIFDQLFVTDKAGTIHGHLAESIETDDDGKTWTMKVPSGITFHDGTPFNAQAVAFHIQRVGAEGSRSHQARDARNMTGLETPDDNTLIITLTEPTMTLPTIFASGTPLSFIPSPTAVQTYGDQIAFHPVGVGAFKLKSFTSGGDTVVEKNPDYRIDGKPYLDQITFLNSTDTQSRLAAAVAGDIDLASSQSGVDLRDAERQGLTVLYQPSYTYFNLLFNLSKPPFDDVRFREAVMRAIDLDALNESVFDGLNESMTGLFPSDNPFYIDTDWPSFDPEKAKELVEDWAADTGAEPSFLLTTTSPPEFQKQAAIMQQMLEDVGIDMQINVGDQPTMITEALSGNYNAQHRYVGLAPEVIQGLWNQFSSKSAANITHASDPTLDKLLDEGRMLVDESQKAELFENIQEALRDWLPYMPQIRHTTGWYVGDRVGGFGGTWTGGNLPILEEIFSADYSVRFAHRVAPDRQGPGPPACSPLSRT